MVRDPTVENKKTLITRQKEANRIIRMNSETVGNRKGARYKEKQKN